jgi:membrane protease YdiL (CAAX protease family)
MMPMHQTLGAFRAALLAGWIGLSASGLLYARQKGIPLWAALPIIAAFLFEYSFYLVPGFEALRERLRARLAGWQLALFITLSAVLPYLIYSIPTGQFRFAACALLLAMMAAVPFWYVLLPKSPVSDILFLVLLAAIVLSRWFSLIYTSPVREHLDILGHLALIHAGAMAALELRRVQGLRFGFIPSQKEAVAGVRYFFYFLPIGFPFALWLGVVHLNFTPFLFGKTLATFFGALWVTALSEEFAFRGLLQQWLAHWTGKPRLALVLASLLYGAAHLSFRSFPNWRLAAVTAVLGWFCGVAFLKTSSIRASMVTHALVATLWRTMFVS